ncbi:glycerol-3-phosphate dehydrogenase [NAD(P)+]-like [Schistocerca gregaria]|uniref:glycerol-3-phosphate dehydrogenase [NAD(P)+]-like n=1 Tax=Schistocerca gregaria TaxID=7010 RepID=UPI00211E7E03|nr:glycerol-3-phosphate dehydrogenase [NAD(P)+]-like [Schistocerca gregaria]
MTPSVTSAPPTAIGIFGLGQFGFAMAKILGDKYPKIPIIGYDPVTKYVEFIQRTKKHPIFHKDVVLSPHVVTTSVQGEVIEKSNFILLAVPGQYFRSMMKEICPLIHRDVIFLNTAKALESGTNKNMSEIAAEELANCSHKTWFATLSGGMIAEEITKNWPIAADVACEDISVARYVADLLQTSYFKLNPSNDVLGVQMAGSLKNVISIAAGFYDGLGYDVSSKAAFVSESMREMYHLALALGAKHETFDIGSHAWMGDALTTAFGKSRNRYFGELIGQGMPVADALEQLESQHKRAEGYTTTESFYLLSKKLKLNTPILDIIYNVLFNGEPVKKAILEFWSHSSQKTV